MAHLAELPEWIWQLVASIDRYEDEHPILYRMTDSDVYERTVCVGGLTSLIPRDVRDAADLLAKMGAITPKSMFGGDDD